MYEKQTWVDGVSIANAKRLNHIEEGIENANKMSGNTYFIGYYSQNFDFDPASGEITNLNPDKIMSNNMTFENRILTIGEDGLYYINMYIHHNGGKKRSFVDIGVTDGGTLAPTVIRSQDTQNMIYSESEPTAGDPAYELNRPVFLKKGAKLVFSLWSNTKTTITGGEDFETTSSNISVIKIGNYPEVV